MEMKQCANTSLISSMQFPLSHTTLTWTGLILWWRLILLATKRSSSNLHTMLFNPSSNLHQHLWILRHLILGFCPHFRYFQIIKVFTKIDKLGVCDLRHDEEIISQLLTLDSEELTHFISSPYLNLTKHYTELILKGKSSTQILTASPQANGFFTAKDISRMIPTAYSAVEENLYKEIVSKGQEKRISIFEYGRPNWTFHAKGIWTTFPGETLPSSTVIGSANLGQRSSERDLEAQLLIVTTNEQLKKKIDEVLA